MEIILVGLALGLLLCLGGIWLLACAIRTNSSTLTAMQENMRHGFTVHQDRMDELHGRLDVVEGEIRLIKQGAGEEAARSKAWRGLVNQHENRLRKHCQEVREASVLAQKAMDTAKAAWQVSE